MKKKKIFVPKRLPKYVAEYYKRICKQLDDLGIFQDADLTLIENLSIQLARRDVLTTEVFTNGEVLENSKGTMIVNPASIQLNSCMNTITRLTNQLALDPRSRKSILGNADPDADREEDFNLEEMIK